MPATSRGRISGDGWARSSWSLLALGLALGSRIPPRVAGRTNPLFVQIWLGTFLLILALLLLAFLDWLSTRPMHEAPPGDRPGAGRDAPGRPAADVPTRGTVGASPRTWPKDIEPDPPH